MNKFYHIVSVVLMPLVMPLLGVSFLFCVPQFAQLPAFFKGVTLGCTALFTGVFPLVPMLYLKRQGNISDLFISHREQRLIPYLFSFFSYILWTYFFWRTLQMPSYVVALAAGSALSILVLMVVNVWWKISAHMTGIGGFAGGVFGLCYRLAFNPVWVLVVVMFLAVLLGLARIETLAHTPAQVLAGFMNGFLSVFLCTLIF